MTLRPVTDADVRAAEERSRPREPRRDYDVPAGPRHRFLAWCDAYGRYHEEIPRCCGWTRPGSCHRKGVVKRSEVARTDSYYFEPEHWYCLQHDPRRQDERRVADLAPVLLELLREAVDLMPSTKRAADWRHRAVTAIQRTEERHG